MILSIIKKIVFTVLLFVLVVSVLRSQTIESQDVSGTLFSSQMPIEFCNVLLFNEDSTFVKGVVTNSLGDFTFVNVKSGNYFLICKSLQITEQKIASITVTDKSINLGKITLETSYVKIDEVLIKASLPKIVRKPEKLIIRVENSILADGASMLDLLNYIPTVSVNYKEEITVNRQGGVKIYIDGRASNLDGSSTLDEIIDPSQIEKIEVYATPPARFEAAGSAIINIITIKKKKISNVKTSLGHSLFSIPSELGNSYRYRFSSNLFYNFGNIQTFARVSGGESNDQQISEGSVKYLDSQINRMESGEFNSLSRSVRYSAGIQVDLSEKSKFLLDVNNLNSLGEEIPTVTNYTQEFGTLGSSSIDSSFTSENYLNRNYNNLNLGTSYWLEGENTSFDVQASYSKKSNFNDRKLSLYNNGGFIEEMVNRNYEFNIYDFGVNGSQNFSNERSINFGAKFNNIKYSENLIQENIHNDYSYKEYIFGMYLEYNFSFSKFQINSGLRAEQTSWESKSMTIDFQESTDYFSLFPSISIQNNSIPNFPLTLSYSKRIRRPFVSELNPIKRKRDIFENQFGSGLILFPEYYHNIDLSCSSGNTYASLWYNRTNNRRAFIPNQIEENDIEYKALSVNHSSSLGLGMSHQKSYNNWSGDIYVSVFYDSESLVTDEIIGSIGSSINLNQQYKISPTLTSNLSFNYSTPVTTGYNEVTSIYSLDFTLRWRSLNKKNILSIRIGDILNSASFGFISNYPNLETSTYVLSGSRKVTLEFNYKFGLGNSFQEKKRSYNNNESRIK